jgi:hypothetical protein
MGPNSAGPTRASLSARKGNRGVKPSMARWRRHPSIRRWPTTGGWGNQLGASRRRVVPDFGVRRGSAHQSRAAHGVGGQAGKLDGDSVARRSMAAIDEPYRDDVSVGTSWWWRLCWRKAGGGGACGGARGSSGRGETSVTSQRRGRWCRLTGRRATRCRGGAGGIGGDCGE